MHEITTQPRRCQFTLTPITPPGSSTAPERKSSTPHTHNTKKSPLKAPSQNELPGRQDEASLNQCFPLKPGGQSAVVPPGPVPNPEVKRCRANGSRTIGPARVGRRRDFFHQAPSIKSIDGACSFLGNSLSPKANQISIPAAILQRLYSPALPERIRKELKTKLKGEKAIRSNWSL